MAISRKANVVCIDRHGKGWKRHLFTVNAYCVRCRIWARDWQKTAARRRAGERLVGRDGAVVELINEETRE